MFAKMCSQRYLAVLIVCLMSVGTACQSARNVPAAGVPSSSEPKQTPFSRSETTRELTDDLGRRVQIPAKLERVVSLAPSLTESVFAVGAGDRLVGVTSFCNYPEEARKIAKIGDTMKPNLETIVALRPQLVLLSTDSQLEAFLRQMETQNIPVFVTGAKDFDGVLRNLRQLGEIFDHRDQSEKLISDLQSRVAAVEAKVDAEKSAQRRIRVFVQISREPLYTIGKTSFLTDLVKRAGGESVTANIETAYPSVSRETALASAPEVIVLSVDESMGSQNAAPDEVFKKSPAVKNGKVFKINGDLLTRPSPRTADLVEQLAAALHPESF